MMETYTMAKQTIKKSKGKYRKSKNTKRCKSCGRYL